MALMIGSEGPFPSSHVSIAWESTGAKVVSELRSVRFQERFHFGGGGSEERALEWLWMATSRGRTVFLMVVGSVPGSVVMGVKNGGGPPRQRMGLAWMSCCGAWGGLVAGGGCGRGRARVGVRRGLRSDRLLRRLRNRVMMGVWGRVSR